MLQLCYITTNLTKQKERGFLMSHFTSNTYILKRKILTFTKKISRKLSKPERKFTADITYGILASGSCLLTDVCDQLHEPSKKINVVFLFQKCKKSFQI